MCVFVIYSEHSLTSPSLAYPFDSPSLPPLWLFISQKKKQKLKTKHQHEAGPKSSS